MKYPSIPRTARQSQLWKSAKPRFRHNIMCGTSAKIMNMEMHHAKNRGNKEMYGSPEGSSIAIDDFSNFHSVRWPRRAIATSIWRFCNGTLQWKFSMEAHNGSGYILALIYPKVTLSLVIGAPHLGQHAV